MTDIPPPDNSRQLCPQCNSPVAPDKKFCESCGAKIDSALRCTQCGATISKGIKFCESCGELLAVIPQDKSPSAPVVIPEQALPSIKIEEPVRPPQPAPASILPEPKKPIPTMTLAIIGIVILLVLALAAWVFVLPGLSGTGASEKSGGSTAGSITPVSGSTPGASATGSSSLVTGTLTPGQTQVPPPNLEVNFQAERDPLSGIVTITFTGGAGQNGVREVLARLTRSDGQVNTKMFKITQVGTSENLQGTKMTDRVEVIVSYYNGDRYTVLDQTFEYKKR